jgi:hypothetical protein
MDKMELEEIESRGAPKNNQPIRDTKKKDSYT